MRPWLLVLLSVATLGAADFQAGRASVRITPPAGIPMAGYYEIRLAEGTHDDLFAKAVVFESRGSRAAMVVCDLINLPAPVVAAARIRIEAETGIRGDHVMVSATHSHTGPLLSGRVLAAAPEAARRAAQQYIETLPGKIAESVRLANSALAPARVWAATGQEESLAFNRRFLLKDGTVHTNPGKMNPQIVQPVGPIDPEVPVVYIESAVGRPLALLVNYALHLDTTGGLQFSADYPATLSSLMAKLKGPDLLTLFHIGCAGNVNHIDVKTKAPQKGHAEAQRIGTVLAGEVLKAQARLRLVEPDSVRAARETVNLPPMQVDAAETGRAKEIVAEFGKKSKLRFLDLVQAMKVLDVAERNGAPIGAEVQVIALGDQIAWVGLPGEIFVELGLAIKGASQFPHTIVNELSNGSLGYIPNRKAYAEGGYEVVSARIAPGGGEALAEAAIGLLTNLRRRE